MHAPRSRARSKLLDLEVMVYKGDEVFFAGTVEQAAKELDILPRSILWRRYPSAEKRLEKRKTDGRITIIFLDDEDEK